MKGCLVVLAFVVVAAAAVVGFVVLISGGSSTEESLTKQVQAQVADSEFDLDSRGSQQRGYAVDLRYRVGSTRYAAQAWVPEDQWTPDQGTVAVCTDPDDPASVWSRPVLAPSAATPRWVATTPRPRRSARLREPPVGGAQASPAATSAAMTAPASTSRRRCSRVTVPSGPTAASASSTAA